MLCSRAFVERPATAAFSPWRGVTHFFVCQGFQESTAATVQELAVHRQLTDTSCNLPARTSRVLQKRGPKQAGRPS